ncbi:hypothetical protein H1C71_039969 [Ictidomys tridecemlineatus]|nr:hypothetical protein H1C71_039969 [Ictidomys tridecemlineatus]
MCQTWVQLAPAQGAFPLQQARQGPTQHTVVAFGGVASVFILRYHPPAPFPLCPRSGSSWPSAGEGPVLLSQLSPWPTASSTSSDEEQTDGTEIPSSRCPAPCLLHWTTVVSCI